MKKILTATMAMIMLCSMLASCGSKQNPEPSGTESTSETVSTDASSESTSSADTESPEERPIEEGMIRHRFDIETVGFYGGTSVHSVSGLSIYFDLPDYFKRNENFSFDFLRYNEKYNEYSSVFMISAVYETSDDFEMNEDIHFETNAGMWAYPEDYKITHAKTQCGYEYILYEVGDYKFVYIKLSDNYIVSITYTTDIDGAESGNIMAKFLESVRFVDSNV